MDKLSTKALKVLISTWLSKPNIRKNLEHYSDCYDCVTEDDKRRALDYTADLFGCKLGCTQAQLEEHIWRLWCDGSRWKRVEKRQLKDEAADTFSETKYLGEYVSGQRQESRRVPWFPCDECGDSNPDLTAKYFNEPELAKKCIIRMFVPNNQLADNYRLEVVTTPDDTEVVGWWVMVD